MKKILSLVLGTILVLSLSITPAFAETSSLDSFPGDSATSSTNPNTAWWRTSLDAFGNTVGWGNSIYPNISIPQGSSDATDSPIGFLYDLTRVPVDINTATPELYGRTIQSTGTHFDQNFNLLQYPGAANGLEGIWYVQMHFFSRSAYATATQRFALGVDLTKPLPVAGLNLYSDTTTITPVGSVVPTDRLQVRWTDNEYDALSGTSYYQLYYDGKPWANTGNENEESGRVYRLPWLPASVTAENLTPGVHTISISAVDRATNEGPKTTTQIVVDPDIPTVKLTSPAANSVVGAKTAFSADAVDKGGVKSVTFYVDDTQVGTELHAPYSLPISLVNFSNGTHTVTAVVEDVYGRRTHSNPINITLDRTVPVISSLSDTPDPFYPRKREGYRDNSIIHFNLSEAAHVKVQIYNSKGVVIRTLTADKTAGKHTMKWNGNNSEGKLAAAGTYYYKVTATDSAGNIKSTAKYATHLAYVQFVFVNRSTVKVIER